MKSDPATRTDPAARERVLREGTSRAHPRGGRGLRVAAALRGALGAGVACAIVISPYVAQACSACIDPNAENRTAFIVTTVLLSVLPLLMVGGMVAWLWRRSQQLQTVREPRAIPAAAIRT